MTRYVAYYRVSSKKQGVSGLGLAAQKNSVHQFLGDAMPVGEFVEVESGAKSDRVELERALTLCELTGSDLIVATLSRLSRDTMFLETVKLRCAAGNFKFVCVDMPTADSFTLGIMSQLAAYERTQVSVRTIAALKVAKKNGTRLGNPQWRKNFQGTEKLAAERSAKRHMGDANSWANKRRDLLNELRAGGLSLSGIARALTDRGITTRRGGKWHARTVANLITRLAA